MMVHAPSTTQEHLTPELEADAEKRLIELAEGWEAGALLERAIVEKFQPLIDAFIASEPDSAANIRIIRAALDSKSAAERFEKDAAAIRLLLALVSARKDATSTTSGQ